MKYWLSFPHPFLIYKFKIILNIWYRIWSIREFKFFILCWSWCFKFIVLRWLSYICPYIENAENWWSNIFFFLLKSILSVRLSNSLRGSDVSLFLEFINIASLFVLYIYWIHDIGTHFYSDFSCSIQRLYDSSDFIY